MQINFRKIALASAFMSVLTPLFCAPSARVSLPFNYQQQEQRKKLFASTLAAAKKFVASKTRLQLTAGIVTIGTIIGVIAITGLTIASDYYKESDPDLSQKLNRIVSTPIHFLGTLITSPVNFYRIMRYGEIRQEKIFKIFDTYEDCIPLNTTTIEEIPTVVIEEMPNDSLNQNSTEKALQPYDKTYTHEKISDFETRIHKLAEKFPAFNLSLKKNDLGKEFYYFERKNSNAHKTRDVQDQRYVVETLYSNKERTDITPTDTLYAIELALSNTEIHTIKINKSGFSYDKHTPLKEPDGQARDGIVFYKVKSFDRNVVGKSFGESVTCYYPIETTRIAESPK